MSYNSRNMTAYSRSLQSSFINGDNLCSEVVLPGAIYGGFPSRITTKYYDDYYRPEKGLGSIYLELAGKLSNMSKTHKLFFLQSRLDELYKKPWDAVKRRVIHEIIEELTNGPVQTSNTYTSYTGRSRTLFCAGLTTTPRKIKGSECDHIQRSYSPKSQHPDNVDTPYR